MSDTEEVGLAQDQSEPVLVDTEDRTVAIHYSSRVLCEPHTDTGREDQTTPRMAQGLLGRPGPNGVPSFFGNANCHFTRSLPDSRALWCPVNGSSSSSPAWAVQLPPLGNQALAVHIPPICGDGPGRGPAARSWELDNRCDLKRR